MPTKIQWAEEHDKAIIDGVVYRRALPTEGVYPGDICVNDDGTYEVAGRNYVCFPNESDGEHMRRVGKKAAGNTLDGQIWEQAPEVLK
jgi:hypothetical protein